MKERHHIVSFDYLKGIAIFLVVWTHCIQYICGQTFDNPFYALAYTFHMPLFMIISGYLFAKKLSATLIENVRAQFIRLMLPNIMGGGDYWNTDK